MIDERLPLAPMVVNADPTSAESLWRNACFSAILFDDPPHRLAAQRKGQKRATVRAEPAEQRSFQVAFDPSRVQVGMDRACGFEQNLSLLLIAFLRNGHEPICSIKVAIGSQRRGKRGKIPFGKPSAHTGIETVGDIGIRPREGVRIRR